MLPAAEPRPPRRLVDGPLLAIATVAAAIAWTWLSRPPSTLALYENALLRACLLGIAVSLVAARRTLRALAATATLTESLLLMAIALTAFAVRFATEALPWHAYNWVEQLAQRLDPEPEPFWYGNGFPVFMRIPLALGLAPDRAIFVGNRVLGALAAPALYAADRVLGGSPRKALLSSALLALVPMHALLSSSETMQLLPSLCALVAIVGFGAHVRTGNRACVFAGILAVVFGVLARPEGALTALPLALLYVGRDRARRLLDPALWGGCMAALALGGPLYLNACGWLSLGQNGAWGGHQGAMMVATPAHSVVSWWLGLSTAGRVEQAIGVLAIAGLIVMAVRGPRRQLAVVLAFLALQIELAGYEDNFANRWQLQSPEWPFMALAAAAVPSLLLDWLPPISSSLKLSIGLCCLLGGSLLCKWAMPPLSDQQEEWRFLRAHEDILTKANPSLPIVRFARGDDEDPAFPAFPSYRLRGDVPLYSIKDLFSGKVPLPALYFRGPHCYTKYGSFDFAGDERPLCAELERRYRMEPVVTETLHSRSFTGTRVGPPSFEIGYYRITGTR